MAEIDGSSTLWPQYLSSKHMKRAAGETSTSTRRGREGEPGGPPAAQTDNSTWDTLHLAHCTNREPGRPGMVQAAQPSEGRLWPAAAHCRKLGQRHLEPVAHPLKKQANTQKPPPSRLH